MLADLILNFLLIIREYDDFEKLTDSSEKLDSIWSYLKHFVAAYAVGCANAGAARSLTLKISFLCYDVVFIKVRTLHQ
jgi:VanZ family protein